MELLSSCFSVNNENRTRCFSELDACLNFKPSSHIFPAHYLDFPVVTFHSQLFWSSSRTTASVLCTLKRSFQCACLIVGWCCPTGLSVRSRAMEKTQSVRNQSHSLFSFFSSCNSSQKKSERDARIWPAGGSVRKLFTQTSNILHGSWRGTNATLCSQFLQRILSVLREVLFACGPKSAASQRCSPDAQLPPTCCVQVTP